MNAAALWLAPWRATPARMRWYVRLAMAAAVLIAGAIGLVVHRQGWATAAGGVLAFAAFFLGLFLLAPTLLLATDARHLRLPRMQRDVLLGAGLWALALVLVPVAALALAGADATTMAALLAMALCGGITVGLLPRYVAAMTGLLPMAFNTLAPAWDVPGPGEPGFVALCAAVAALLLALSAWCWRRQLRADEPYRQDWTQPMVLHFRRPALVGGWRGLSAGLPDSSQQIRQQPGWLRAQVALGPSGPQRPRYSLRVALGGMFAPLTAISRARQLAVAALPSVLVMALLLLQSARRHGDLEQAAAWASHQAALFGWFAALIGLLVALLAVMQLSQRWQKTNAEVPLLALLPGLGTPQRARRALLQASLAPGVGVQLGMMGLIGALAAGWHIGWVAAGALLLTQLGAMVLLVAFGLVILGGRPLPGWGSGAIVACSVLLCGLSLFVSLLGDDAARIAGGHLLAALAGGWAALLAALLGVARRGWRGLSARPHPFMANEVG